jgi:hypothetical protein
MPRSKVAREAAKLLRPAIQDLIRRMSLLQAAPSGVSACARPRINKRYTWSFKRSPVLPQCQTWTFCPSVRRSATAIAPSTRARN